MAEVPNITLLTPFSMRYSISSYVLIPPPASTGTSTNLATFVIISPLTIWPSLAPSKSTICIAPAPISLKYLAISIIFCPIISFLL